MNALVDTNLLVYAYDKDAGAKHTRAVAFLEPVFMGEKTLYVSVQNLAELFKILTVEKAVPLDEAREIVLAFVCSKHWVKINYRPETVVGAMQLFTSGSHFWDCLLAATALEHFVSIIYTENTNDFQKIPGIRVVNPLV